MTTDDDRTAELLARALAEEAAGVDTDPSGLQTIRGRIGSSSTAGGLSTRRPWVLGAVGAGLATAVVITAVVLGTQRGAHDQTPVADPPGVTHHSAPGYKAYVSPRTHKNLAVTMHYLGSAPDALTAARLYSERHVVALAHGTRAEAAVHEFLTSSPRDPDYSTGWPAGTDVTSITTAQGVTTISLIGSSKALGTHPYPVPYNASREVSIQAILATAGVHGKAAFTLNGKPTELLLSTTVAPTVSTQSEDMLRAWISIDNIVNGQTMTNPVTVQVSGNAYEGNVAWQLLDADGAEVDHGFVTTSQGSWRQVSVPLGTLAAGAYTFKAYEPSAANGRETHLDDKTFTVQ